MDPSYFFALSLACIASLTLISALAVAGRMTLREGPKEILSLTRETETRLPRRPLKVFFCYAEEDMAYHLRLEQHLASLKREGLIENWHHHLILPGAERVKITLEKLEAADLVLWLISPASLSSEYLYEQVMARALLRHTAGMTLVVPILLRPTDWESAEFANLQPLPANRKPIATWNEQDEAWLSVSKELRALIAARLG